MYRCRDIDWKEEYTDIRAERMINFHFHGFLKSCGGMIWDGTDMIDSRIVASM